jgi:hypothetical protein
MNALNATTAVVIAGATALAALTAGFPVTTAVAAGAAVLAAWTVSVAASYVRWSVLLYRVRAQLRDRTGYLLATVVFGAILAAGRSPLEAAAAAIATLAVKVTVAAALPAPHVPRPRLAAGSDAALWLTRAEVAVEATRQFRPGRGALSERFAATREGAHETLVLVRRLAAHEAVVARMLGGIGRVGLAEEIWRLETERAQTDSPAIKEEIGRALAALGDQRAARARLKATDDTLVARMRTAAIGLEGLVARLAEIIALAEGGADATAYVRVTELADELDALRAGLSEADSLGRATVHELRPLNSEMEVRK